ncbi:ATP-binding response regulator [Motilimonas cestriensis]|uniref:ATP-binding response regulator n=1 Tax=Motilimonas cestriensis TaxID=2742685 RepID=UPI003DA69193
MLTLPSISELKLLMSPQPNKRDRICPFSGYFADEAKEAQAQQQLWPSQAQTIRVPLIIFSVLIVCASYLDYVQYQFEPHYFVFLSLRLLLAGLAGSIYWQSTKASKPRHFNALVGVFQLYILCFFFAIFYDRWFLNPLPSISETFYTVLFISYPLLACYVFPSRLWISLWHSLLAVLMYIFIINMIPETRLEHHITELVTCLFFVYYSYHLMRTRHRDQRQLLLYEAQQQNALSLAIKVSQDKSRFIAATSHDLRQPLHSLNIYNELLTQQLKATPSINLLEKSRLAIDSLSQYFEALIDISRLDAGNTPSEKVHFQLQSVLKSVVDELQALAQKNQVKLALVNTHFIAYSDPILVRKVLEQLVKNALIHSRSDKVLIGIRRQNGKGLVQVWDQGQGIPADQTDNIFDEFKQLDNPERNRNKGLGLGLALAKKVSNLLALNLTVTSTPNHCCVFSFELPKGDASKQILLQRDEGEKTEQANQAVLLVDDDEMVLEAMTAMLDSWGYQVFQAANGNQAMALAIEHTVQLVITDYNLPGGYNGPTLLNKLNQQYQTTLPAIILTGDINLTPCHSTQQYGYLLLHKPVKGAQLRMAIRKLCPSL